MSKRKLLSDERIRQLAEECPLGTSMYKTDIEDVIREAIQEQDKLTKKNIADWIENHDCDDWDVEESLLKYLARELRKYIK